jgi:hypothetical protein
MGIPLGSMVSGGSWTVVRLRSGSRWQSAVQHGEQQQDEADRGHDPDDAVHAARADGGVKDDPEVNDVGGS